MEAAVRPVGWDGLGGGKAQPGGWMSRLNVRAVGRGVCEARQGGWGPAAVGGQAKINGAVGGGRAKLHKRGIRIWREIY